MRNSKRKITTQRFDTLRKFEKSTQRCKRQIKCNDWNTHRLNLPGKFVEFTSLQFVVVHLFGGEEGMWGEIPAGHFILQKKKNQSSTSAAKRPPTLSGR